MPLEFGSSEANEIAKAINKKTLPERMTTDQLQKRVDDINRRIQQLEAEYWQNVEHLEGTKEPFETQLGINKGWIIPNDQE